MQVLADGRVLVGWGNLPYFSEFAADGTLLLDGQFPVGDQSYRVFAADWTGHPADKPAVAARVEPGRRFGRVRELERGDRAGHVDGAGREDGG